MNCRASGQCGLSLYYLIELLDREARLTAVAIRLISDRKLKQVQWRQYRNLQAMLFDSWEKYKRKEKTTAQLLRMSPSQRPDSRELKNSNQPTKNGSFRSYQVCKRK